MSHVDHGFSEEEQIHNGRSSVSIIETTGPSRFQVCRSHQALQFPCETGADAGIHKGGCARTIRQMCSRNNQIIQGFLKRVSLSRPPDGNQQFTHTH